MTMLPISLWARICRPRDDQEQAKISVRVEYQRSLISSFNLLFISYYLIIISGCYLFVATCYLLLITSLVRLAIVIQYLLFTLHPWRLIIYCSLISDPFTTCYLLLLIDHSLCITYYLSLTPCYHYC